MSKNFVLFFLAIILSVFHVMPQTDESFDEWLAKILAPEPTEKPKKAVKSEPAAKPEAAKPEEAATPEYKAQKATILKKIQDLEKLLGELNNVAQDSSRFSPDFIDKVKNYIQSGKLTKPTTADLADLASTEKSFGKIKKSKKGDEEDVNEQEIAEFANSTKTIKGALGFLALLQALEAKKPYRMALVNKKHKDVLPALDATIAKLNSLKNESLALRAKKFKKGSEEEQLQRLLKPSLRTAQEQNIAQLKAALQQHILDFYSTLTPTIENVKKVFVDKDVQKDIKEKREKREEEITQAQARQKHYHPSKSSYESPYPWRKTREDREEREWGGEGTEGTTTPAAETIKPTETPEAKKEEEDKKYKGPKDKLDKEKEEKEERKKNEENEKKRLEHASFVALYDEATKLINQVCASLKPDTACTDASLKKTLFAQAANINTLNNVSSEINSRKPSALSDKDIQALTDEPEPKEHKKKTTPVVTSTKHGITQRASAQQAFAQRGLTGGQQVKTEPEVTKEPKVQKKPKTPITTIQSVSDKLASAFTAHIPELLKLCKYNEIATFETADGTFNLKAPSQEAVVIATQHTLQNTYKTLKSLMPELKEQIQAAETTLDQTIRMKFNETLTAMHQQASGFTLEKQLLQFGRQPESLAASLHAVLQLILIAKSAPVVTPLDISQNEKNDLELLRETAQGKFSPEFLRLMKIAQDRRSVNILQAQSRSPGEVKNPADVSTILKNYAGQLWNEVSPYLRPTQQSIPGKAAAAPGVPAEQIFPYLLPEEDTDWIKLINANLTAAKQAKAPLAGTEGAKLNALREAYRYDVNTVMLNELNKMNILLDRIGKETNWITPTPDSPIKIEEALWLWGTGKGIPVQFDQANNTILLNNPQVADIHTGLWQHLINGKLKTLQEEHEKKAAGKAEPFSAGINTGVSADCSNLSTLQDTNMRQKIDRFFKHAAANIKQFFLNIFKPGNPKRTLLMIYTIQGKTYAATFAATQNVIIKPSKYEITLPIRLAEGKGAQGAPNVVTMQNQSVQAPPPAPVKPRPHAPIQRLKP